MTDLPPKVEAALVKALQSLNGQPQPPDAAWLPVDLALTQSTQQPAPAILERSDGEFMLYEARIHWCSGQPESGKSWFALLACAQLIQQQRPVIYIDHETHASEVLGRLEALAVPTTDVLAHFRYVWPDRAANPADIATLVALKPALVVVDAATGSIVLHGGDADKAAQVEAWAQLVLLPFKHAGIAVLVLDHVTKDKEKRGPWPIASERKLALADAAFSLQVLRAFGRGREGHALVRVTKDRPGMLKGRAGHAGADGSVVGGELHFNPSPDETVQVTLKPPDPSGPDGVVRPTYLMERMSRFVESCATPPTQNECLEGTTGNRAKRIVALGCLVAEGFLAFEPGARGGKLYRVLRAFRQASDAEEPVEG